MVAVAIVGLSGLFAAGIAILATFPPIELLKQQAIAEIKSRTGRDLVIGGPVSVTVFPALTLEMRDLSLSEPPGMGDQPFAVAASVEARVKLMPLLVGRMALEQLILREPVLNMRIDTAGRPNFGISRSRKADGSPVRYAEAPRSPSDRQLPGSARDFPDVASNPYESLPERRAELAALIGLILADLRIERGEVHWADERTGESGRATSIDTVVKLTSLESPLEATGTLTWSEQPVGFDARLASPRAVMEDQPASLLLAIKAAPVDARFDGALLLRAGPEFDGEMSARGQSLRQLCQWLGLVLPPADGFGAHSLDGKLKARGGSVVLSDLSLSLDGATATGTLAIEHAAPRPKVTGNLKVSLLDLNRYTLAAATAVPRASVPAEPAADRPDASPLEDLINDVLTSHGKAPQPAAAAPVPPPAGDGPMVKGYTARAGWSSEPMRFDALGSFDGDLRLAVGGMRWREIKTGQALVNVALQANALRVTFDDVQLYDGRGRGVVTIDAVQTVPMIGANLSAEGIAGRGLLKDAIGFDRVSGTTKVSLTLDARGTSELELVESLAGKAEIEIANGAVAGFNIAGALRAVRNGQLGSTALAKSPSERTDFSELQASFVIENGIAINRDLRMLGPLLRVGGSGKIMLPARSIDYILRPRVVASLEGQGANDRSAAGGAIGIEVPIRVKGPLADPDFKPDYDGILKDQGKAVEAVKQIGKQLKASGVLRSLLGRGKDTPAAGGQPATGGAPAPAGSQGTGTSGAGSANDAKAAARKLLDGVLGR